MGGMHRDGMCPVCGAPQPREARYRTRLCQPCLDSATDSEGRRLSFSNAGAGGGLLWCYADTPALADWSASHVRCLVGGQPVIVTEARFGGVVAEPDLHPGAVRGAAGLVVDLSRNPMEAATLARLRPVAELKP